MVLSSTFLPRPSQLWTILQPLLTIELLARTARPIGTSKSSSWSILEGKHSSKKSIKERENPIAKWMTWIRSRCIAIRVLGEMRLDKRPMMSIFPSLSMALAINLGALAGEVWRKERRRGLARTTWWENLSTFPSLTLDHSTHVIHRPPHSVQIPCPFPLTMPFWPESTMSSTFAPPQSRWNSLRIVLTIRARVKSLSQTKIAKIWFWMLRKPNFRVNWWVHPSSLLSMEKDIWIVRKRRKSSSLRIWSSMAEPGLKRRIKNQRTTWHRCKRWIATLRRREAAPWNHLTRIILDSWPFQTPISTNLDTLKHKILLPKKIRIGSRTTTSSTRARVTRSATSPTTLLVTLSLRSPSLPRSVSRPVILCLVVEIRRHPLDWETKTKEITSISVGTIWVLEGLTAWEGWILGQIRCIILTTGDSRPTSILKPMIEPRIRATLSDLTSSNTVMIPMVDIERCQLTNWRNKRTWMGGNLKSLTCSRRNQSSLTSTFLQRRMYRTLKARELETHLIVSWRTRLTRISWRDHICHLHRSRHRFRIRILDLRSTPRLDWQAQLL